MNPLEEFKTDLCSGGSVKSVGKAMLETIRTMRRTVFDLPSVQLDTTTCQQVCSRASIGHVACVVSKLTIRQDTPELPRSTHSKRSCNFFLIDMARMTSYRRG